MHMLVSTISEKGVKSQLQEGEDILPNGIRKKNKK
jgi:hypothetical protein